MIVALVALYFVMLSQTGSEYTRHVLVPATSENIERSLFQAKSNDWTQVIIVCDAAGEKTQLVEQVNLKPGKLCGVGYDKTSEWDIERQTSARYLCVSLEELELISYQEKYKSLGTPVGYPTCSEDQL